MSKAVEAVNLTFGYSGITVLENASFSIDKGDYIGIIGPNGSGKSTLVKVLLGIQKPMEGKVSILGQEIDSFKLWDKMGYVSQKAASFNTGFPATVEEVVSANLFSRIGLFRHYKKHHKEKVYEALKVVGMEHYGKSLIGNLSGGQQQRVFIARVLVSSPEIMFLDEPMTGIDAKSEEEVYCLLARLNKEKNITIVMVTHDIGAATIHANKIAYMGNKKIFVTDKEEGINEKMIEKVYGHGVKFQIYSQHCDKCVRREVG